MKKTYNTKRQSKRPQRISGSEHFRNPILIKPIFLRNQYLNQIQSSEAQQMNIFQPERTPLFNHYLNYNPTQHTQEQNIQNSNHYSRVRSVSPDYRPTYENNYSVSPTYDPPSPSPAHSNSSALTIPQDDDWRMANSQSQIINQYGSNSQSNQNENQTVLLKLSGYSNFPAKDYVVPRDTPFNEIKRTYLMEFPNTAIFRPKFMYNGEEILDNDTPNTLEMDGDYDLVDLMSTVVRG